ncbi:Ger(x)C family spore germination protein [Geobacillus sp. C56-T3]|uniref:Ger(x)C family spore germination protein n=1 Tax=Geobacillus sp. (strain C56-T3) TaxID=691437 RepID=UPI0001D58575|nr:Ger(x)C family spore germination protein [Geobacillus sp. C56-T3]ADI26873.1 germination protein, Ger(x)C family [Geobacillus sp. C56-T3]
MRRAITVIVSLAICAGLLSGCWSQKELTDLAFIVAIGLDKTEDGKYLVTFQVVNPGNVAGATQRGGGAAGVPVSIYTSTGDTLVEASRKASEKLSRLPYYAHTNLIVVGEEVAREGLSGVLDAMERGNQLRTTAHLVIARTYLAKDVLTVLTPIDKISANQIIKTIEFSSKNWGETVHVDIWGAIHCLATAGRNLVITGVTVEGDLKRGKRQENVQSSVPDARIKLEGLALFKNDRLVDWVDGPSSRGVLWLLDCIRQTNLTVSWKGKKEAINYQVVRAKTDVKAKVKDGRPVIFVHIQAEGDVIETRVPIDLSDANMLFQLEKEIKKNLKQEVEEAIETAQRDKTDVFGFGEAVHRTDPHLWKKIENEWHDHYFPELDVIVTTDMYIRRTGLRNKPYAPRG